jgi:hypothetical protein
VIEVLTGNTISILPTGEAYDSASKLKKVSLASVRSPRVGNDRLGKPDENYVLECKDRLRVMCTGKTAEVSIHYERDIAMGEVSFYHFTSSLIKKHHIKTVSFRLFMLQYDTYPATAMRTQSPQVFHNDPP